MGELIKKIGKITIHNKEFDVEINEPEEKNGNYIIHIQDSNYRLSLEQNTFFQVVDTVKEAKENLLKGKGM